MTLSFLFFHNLDMIVGHVYTVKSYSIIQYQYENQLFQFNWDLKYYYFSQQPMLLLLSFMGTLMLVSVHNILTVT